MDSKKHKKCPARLTDDQIRDHLTATSFHGLLVTQSHIDRARRLLDDLMRYRSRPAPTRTLIPGDYD